MVAIKQNQERISREIALRRALLNKKKQTNVKNIPKWQFPFKEERFYAQQLTKIVNLINEAMTTALIPLLPSLQNELLGKRPDIKNDDFIDDLNGALNNMQIFVNKNQDDPEVLASTVGSGISQFNQAQNTKIMHSAFGVNILQQEPWLTTQLDLFTQQNADLIKNIIDKSLHDIKGIVTRGFAQGTSLTDMTSDLRDRIGMTKRRAKLIARDQTSKLNGQLTQLRQTQNGVSSYVWTTAGDERVRPTHAMNEGQTFKWNDPPATGHPGSDYSCRCTAIPVLDDLL